MPDVVPRVDLTNTLGVEHTGDGSQHLGVARVDKHELGLGEVEAVDLDVLGESGVETHWHGANEMKSDIGLHRVSTTNSPRSSPRSHAGYPLSTIQSS